MNSRHLGAAIFLLVVAGIIIWAARFSNPQEIVRSTLLWISQLGPWAPVLFVFAYIIACLIFFPGVILTLGAGVLFGVVKGTILVAVGATLGACSAFAIARFLARDWVKEKFGSYSHFKAIDEAVAEKGWKVVGMIRLSPVFPFIPMNFLFGLTRIPFLHFAFATFFGLIPLTSMFVYLGKLAGDLANIGPSTEPWTTFHYIVAAFGLTSTISVSVYITMVAKKALKMPANIG